MYDDFDIISFTVVFLGQEWSDALDEVTIEVFGDQVVFDSVTGDDHDNHLVYVN